MNKYNGNMKKIFCLKSWEIWEGFIYLSRILKVGMISNHSILLLSSNLMERYIFFHSISPLALWSYWAQTLSLAITTPLLKFPFQGSYSLTFTGSLSSSLPLVYWFQQLPDSSGISIYWLPSFHCPLFPSCPYFPPYLA